MNITQLIYTSEPFGFDDAMLNGILSQSRRNNPRRDISGCLICRHDIYLQMLEGPSDAIDDLYARIAVDDRHLAVTKLSTAIVPDRMFGAWAMRDDPARSWMWSAEQVGNGAARDAAPDALRAVFARVLAEDPPRP